MAPQREGPREVVISAVSPVEIPEGDSPGEDQPEADSEALDAGPREAVDPEAHPALAAGHRWAVVSEAEDLLAVASAEVVAEAEAPGVNSTHRG